MSAPSTGSIRVLHVDDDPDFADIAAAFLEREGDHIEVVTAASADEGLDRLDEGVVECVVSDYEMPDRNGIEFLEAVRERHPDLPFILFTGKGSEEVASEAVSSGVTDYLQKGSGTEQYELLANRIENAVSKWRIEHEIHQAYRAIETASEGISILDADGLFTYVNEAYADTYGYEPGELIGEHWEILYPPDAVSEIREEVLPAAYGDGEWRGETRGRRKDGSILVEDHSLSSTADGGLVCTVRDVTERRERERELEQYETIVETIPVGVGVIDEDGVIVGGNERGAGILGYDVDDLVGEPFERLVEEGVYDEGFVDDYRESARELLSGDSERDHVRVEYSITVDGEERYVESYVALRPFEEEYRGTISAFRDVTERRERQRELEHERDRFESLFETLPEPVALVSGGTLADATVARINPAFEEVFGYGEARIRGEHLNDSIVPEDRREEAERIDRASARDELEPTEVRRRTADGELRDFLLLVTNFEAFGEDDVWEGFAIYADITERKQREQELHRQREQYQQLIETAPVPMIIYDDEKLIRYANDATLDFLGVGSDGELVGERVTDLVHPADLERAEGRSGRVIEDREPAPRAELRLRTPDGTVKHTILSGTPITYGGERAGQVVINDITDRVRTEREVRRQNARLEQFASIVSHDLRNPLNVAQGRLELARTGREGDHLASVADALDRMGTIIEDTLTLARQGQTIGEKESVGLTGVAERCWRTVETADADLYVRDDVTIRADPNRVRHLFENLFRNAIEHGGEGVTVRVGALSDGGFYVEDDGSGIPADEREEVFDPGYTTDEDGVGFGLAIVRETADAHGWEVTIAEGSDGGTRFEFTGV